MRLSAPKQVTWWIALILGVLGVIATFVTIPGLTEISFWLVVVGWVLLLLATVIEGI